MDFSSTKNVTPINEKELLQEQACQWISKIDRGLTESEKQELTLWVSQSDGCKTALFEMAALWDDLSVMHELSGLFPLAERNTTAQRGKRHSVYLATAASGALLCAVFVSWFMASPQSTLTEVVTPQSVKYETGVGQQKTVTLADGSLLSMNTSSRVEVLLSNERRDISITKGEAHFEVESDALRPFVVSAGNNKVTAIGTAFNVQLLENERFELLVTEGKVLVSEINQPTPGNISELKSQDFEALGTIMLSGDTAVFDGFESEAVNTLSLDQVQRNLSWQQGMLVFQGESLEDALVEMSRYTDSEFEIMDDSLKSLRVAGYFKVGDSEGLLHALQNNFDIEHQTVNNVIQLTASSSL